MVSRLCAKGQETVSVVKIFWYCLHFGCCSGLTLRQCEEGWVQVPETSQSAADVLTCTGVPSSQTVYWQLKSATGSNIVRLGTCPPLPGTCTSSLNTFTVSRPSTNVSNLTPSGSVSRSLAGATLYCYSGSTTANRVGCQVDIVHPAEGVTCDVQLSFPTTFPWTASGHCDIANIYSSQNNYNCTWFESNGTSAQVIASTYVEWRTNPLSTDPVVYSAICTMKEKPIPARNANYTYSVTVSPGLGSVNAKFNGSSIVYPPRTPPTITGYGGRPLFAGHFFSLTCTVVGGVPPVTSVKLDCGDEEQNANGQNVTINFTLKPQHHGQSCVCSAVWKQTGLYTLTSEVTLTVYYAPVVIAMTVNGAEGQTEVNESNTGHVSLSCSARASPTADMQLLKDIHGELVQRKGGEVGDTDTATLTYRLPARCESSAQYSCVAENSLGKSTLTNVTLVVLCSPRLNSENSAPDLPSVNFKGVPKNMTFDTWTSPVPVSFSFVYLGQDVKVIRSSQPARVNMFEIYCSKTGLSRATCVMTLTEATEEDEGYYAVIMRNTVGEGNFTFRVRVNDTELDYAEDQTEPYSDKSQSSVLYVGVGVAVGVFVVVAAILLTVFLWRRRQREHDGAQQLTESGPERDSGYLTPAPPTTHRADMTGLTGPLYEHGSGYLTPVQPSQHIAERTGPYATLDSNDINVTSAYDVLSHYDVISDSPADGDCENGPSGQYETLKMTDVGLRSSYTQI